MEAVEEFILKIINDTTPKSVKSHTLIKYQPFPVELFPNSIHRFINEHSSALNVPPSLIAVPILSILSSAIGNSRSIQIKRTWIESSTLWTALIAPSGTGKSPALAAALNPIYDLEKESFKDYSEKYQEYEANLSQWNNSKKLQSSIPKPIEPNHKRYKISDTTIEALIVRHVENPRGLLLARDELSGFFGSFDRYAKGEADMQSFIELYEGRPISVDRKSTKHKVLTINQPHVSITGTVQPGILQSKLNQTHFESGFFARFILCAPPVKQTGWTDEDVTDSIVNNYQELIRTIYAIPFSEEPKMIILEGESKKLFAKFVNESSFLRNSLSNKCLQSVISKMDAICAKIALIFQVIDKNSNEKYISTNTMYRAIKLTRWLRYETIRVWKELGFDRIALSKDQRLLLDLPYQFTTETVANIFGISQRQAQRKLKPLLEKGRIIKIRKGGYQKVEKMSGVDYDASNNYNLSKLIKPT